MSEKYAGPAIRFHLSIGLTDDRYVWVKAPSNWATMSEKERDRFVVEESEEWANQYIEYGASVFSSPDEAREATREQWDEGRYSDDQLDEWFD